jgi:hypothetical protein
MNAKQYLTITAVLAVIYAIGFLVIPGRLLILYGTPDPDPHIVLTAQYFGVALLSLGLIVWFVRNCADNATIRGVLIASVIGDVVGFLLTLWGITQGTLNASGWSTVVIYGLLAIGALYLLLLASPEKLTNATR